MLNVLLNNIKNGFYYIYLMSFENLVSHVTPPPNNVPTETLHSGEPNPKYVDLLTETPPTHGPKWASVSFISPKDLIQRREDFLFTKFIHQWDFIKSMDKYTQFVHYMAYKYNLNTENLLKDFQEFLVEEGTKIRETSVADTVNEYKTFLDKNEDVLTEKFNKDNKFQTSVSGLKIHEATNTEEEAKKSGIKARERDPNHDVHVMPLGYWVPMHPDAYKTGNIEFLNQELNELHHEKIKSDEKSKIEFERRVRETKERAIKENVELATKTGNKLTQDIDENGQLTNLVDTLGLDDREVASPDVRDELFEKMRRDANV